jgi:hypothetical protein
MNMNTLKTPVTKYPHRKVSLHKNVSPNKAADPCEVASDHQAKLSDKDAVFRTLFASAAGAGTIGSIFFGLPGLLVGAVIGVGVGLYVRRRAHAR